MFTRASRRYAPANGAPVVSGASSISARIRKTADETPTAPPKKSKRHHTANRDGAIRVQESTKKLTSEGGSASVRSPTGTRRTPSFSIHPEATLTAFQKSPPDVHALPIINQAPIDVLRVFVFGLGDMSGELGLGPNIKSTPLPVSIPKVDGREEGGYPIVQIACGGMHAIALTQEGKIVTWGGNDEGTLGRDTAWEGGLREMDAEAGDSDGGGSGSEDEALNQMESTPAFIPGSSFHAGTRFTSVAAGESCSFAVTETGLVYGWGTFRDSDSNKRFLGYNGEHIKNQLTPMLIPGIQNIKSVVCGANHALAVDTSSRVWSWGENEKLQLGRRLYAQKGAMDNSFYPHVVNLSRYGVKCLAAGPYHSLAVDNRDRIWAWGMNNLGHAGHAKTAGKDGATLPYPLQIRALSGQQIQLLAAGEQHSAAVTSDGRCLVWGYIDKHNGFKLSQEQISDRSLVMSDDQGRPRILLQPVAVPNIGQAAYVLCSRSHTIFVNRESRAFASGFGDEGQLGNGTEGDNDVAKTVEGLNDAHVIWAGTGGTFSMVAASLSQSTMMLKNWRHIGEQHSRGCFLEAQYTIKDIAAHSRCALIDTYSTHKENASLSNKAVGSNHGD